MSEALLHCPKCGHEQPTGFDECVHCGVVFAKLQLQNTAPVVEADESVTPEPALALASLPEVYDVTSARNALAVARQVLPEVESAYVPSGAVEAPGVVMVVLGALLGAVGGIVAGGVVWALGGILVKALVGLSGAMFEFCELPILMLLLTVVVAALAYMLRIFAVCWVVAFAVARLGKLGKNRNVPTAVLLALFAGGGVGMVLRSEAPAYLPELDLSTVEALGIEDPSSLIGSLDGMSGALAYWGETKWTGRLNVAAALFMAFFAAALAAEHVGGQKFCEACSEYMVSAGLGISSWEEAQLLVHAYLLRDLAAIKQQLRRSGGGPCETTLFACPRCREGYVESMAKFFWKGKGKDIDDQVEDKWLFASLPLSRNDMRALR